MDENQSETILVEVTAPSAGFGEPDDDDYGKLSDDRAFLGRIVAIDSSLLTGQLRDLVGKFATMFAELPRRPEEAELTFAVKVTGDVGLVISKMGGEASLQVRMLWRNGPPPGATTPLR